MGVRRYLRNRDFLGLLAAAASSLKPQNSLRGPVYDHMHAVLDEYLFYHAFLIGELGRSDYVEELWKRRDELMKRGFLGRSHIWFR
jgi:hypothetical protein